jgi:hypothetical protein
MWLFVDLWLFLVWTMKILFENFSLIWRHYFCRGGTAKFRPMLGICSVWGGSILFAENQTQDLNILVLLFFFSISFFKKYFCLWQTKGLLGLFFKRGWFYLLPSNLYNLFMSKLWFDITELWIFPTLNFRYSLIVQYPYTELKPWFVKNQL